MGQVEFVLSLYLLQVLGERDLHPGGQHGDAVLVAFTGADRDLISGKVHVLDSEPCALQQAQASAVEQDRHETGDAAHALKNGADLFAGEHDGQANSPLGSHDIVEPGQVLLEHAAIEKQDGTQGLVLGRRGDVLVDDESTQELCDLGASHLGGMAFLVEENEPEDPRNIGLFGPPAIVASTDGRANSVEKPRGLGR